MTKAPLQTDRRVALRSLACAALAAPLVGACDATDTTSVRAGSQPTSGAAGGDAGLVASLARRMAGLRAAATELAKHDHGRRSWALDLAALHQQHLRRLGATDRRVAVVHAPTAQDLAAKERQLQDALTRAAGRAESGALAQVLASMAAAVEQRLVVA